MAVGSILLVEAVVRKRADSDTTLSFGAYLAWFLVLLVLTMGLGNVIQLVVIEYQLIQRRNRHAARQHELVRALVHCFQDMAEEAQNERLSEVAQRAEWLSNSAAVRERERDAWLWGVLLPLVTLGVSCFYNRWFLNDDYHHHAAIQGELLPVLSEGLRMATGRSVALHDPGSIPRRGFWEYVLLTVITLGVFWFYWQYVLFEDLNEHFRRHQIFEDQIVGHLRAI